ncbi:MAG: hypothetical protein ABI533_01685 [Betaproteobacteria bacterium]
MQHDVSPGRRSAVPPMATTQHRLRDIVFTIVFVATLAALGAAAFRPRTDRTLDAENRTMAPWPALSPLGAWPAAFEQAFADRFGARARLLQLHNRVQVRAFGVPASPNVVIGRDGWLYFLGEDGTAFDRYYRGTLPVPDAELTAVVAEFRRRAAFLAGEGIAYVVTVAPDKSTIYDEHLPRWATRVVSRTPLDRLVDEIHADGSLRFVDLRAPLRDAKTREHVYFATDSHWNLLGAAVAYRALMREVSDALPSLRGRTVTAALPPYVPGVDVYSGDLARLTGDPASFSEPDLAPLGKVLAAPHSRCAQRIDDAGRNDGFEWYACDRTGLPRAVVYRDSMAIPLIPLLSENFSRAAYVSSHRLDPAFVRRERPDIVIDELVERSLLAPAATPMPDPAGHRQGAR